MSLVPNQQLYEYHVERVLGQGPSGTIYLAHDTLLNRPVAIKELTVTVQTDEVAFKQFLQEARIAGSLNHPHIVTVYAVKIVGANVYLVMEYMAGGSLRALLEQRGPLPVEEAVRIAADVCEGLAAAHAETIIHQDVKPENTLLMESGQAKAGDFGIAHLPHGAGGTYLSALTATEFQPETLLYRSPEQIRGQQADERSDVYQVGVLLVEMLTGRHYVDLEPLERQARKVAGSDAASFQAQLYELLAEAICEQEPEGVREVRPDVPEWVGELAAAALSKRAEERPTAEKLGRALRRGETVPAAPPMSAGAADVTAAEEHFKRGLAHAEQERWDEAIHEFQAALRIDPDLAKAHYNLGLAYGERGLPDEALREFQAALRIDPNLASAHYNLGLAYGRQGRVKESLREFRAWRECGGKWLRFRPGCVLLGVVLLALPTILVMGLGLAYVQQGPEGEIFRVIGPALQFGVKALPILLLVIILPILVVAFPWLWSARSKKTPEGRVGRGVAYVERGRLDEAIGEFQAALRMDPDYAKAHYGLAVAYAKQECPGEAIREAEIALQLGFEPARTLLDTWDKIARELRATVQANPDDAETHYELGQVYIETGRWDEALHEYQATLRINPDHDDAHTNLGLVYAEQECWNEAIREHQAATRINPDNARAHNNLGSTYERQSLWDEAIQAYQAALRIDPYYAKPHFGLAACYCEKGQLDEATREAETALRLGFGPARDLLDKLRQVSSSRGADPQAGVWTGALGKLEIAPGKLERNVRELQATLRANPNDAEAHRELGLLYEYQGRLDEAIHEYQAALNINPNYAEAHADLGVAYGQQGRPNDGIRENQAALRINPNLSAPHYNLGLIYQEQGQTDEAIREYRAALRVNPNYAEAHRNLGVIYAEQGRLDEAIRAYQAALRAKPDFADAHFSLGLAYGQQGRLEEAIRSYQAALQINPDDAEAHVNLGNIYQEQDRLDQAIREYQAALQIKPDDILAHTNLGVAHLQQEHWDEAIRECQAAVRIDPNLAQAHYNLGAAYGARGRLDDEIREYQAAVRINPEYTLARANLGMAYGQQGRWDEATREAETALGSEQARSLLDILQRLASPRGAGGPRYRVTLSGGEVIFRRAASSSDTEP